MYKARFLYDIYEEKFAINPYYSCGYRTDDNWHLAEEYECMGFPPGYKARNVMRYVKIKDKDVVFHEEDINIILEKNNVVKIKDEIVTIIGVVRNLDGNIDYLIDKKEYIPLNTEDTYFDERPEEQTPPSGRIVYENFTGSEKEYNFWKRFKDVFRKVN